MSAALWEKSLEGKNYDEVATLAVAVPQSLVSLSTGAANEVTRANGLILTKDQIISLRKYEATGLALPTNERALATYLNFGDEEGGMGFTKKDFLMSFTKVNAHASLWSPLRSRIMLTGTHLKLFGSSMGVYLTSVEEIFADVKAAKALGTHKITNYAELREWEVKEGKPFPDLALEADTIPDLGDVLDQIFEQVKEHLRTAAQIKSDLDHFSRQLTNDVIPTIKLLSLALENNTFASDIEILNDEIKERANQIDELHKEYKALVQKSLSSVSSFSIIGLGVAIYTGVEAEGVRSRRNDLSRAQEAAIKSLESKSKVLGSIARIRGDMQNMQTVALDAEVATNNVVHTWNVLHAYIESSEKAVLKIEDGVRLQAFITQFRLVAAPWVKIEKSADALVELFHEAEQQYMLEYGVQGRKPMRSLMQSDSYPAVKVQNLQGSSSELRNRAVEAKLLFMKTDYLPDLSEKFQALPVNVANGSREAQEKALKTELSLKSTLQQLLSLDEELREGADEIDEIHDEQTTLLREAQTAVSEMSISLGESLKRFNVGYDETAMQGFKTSLMADVSAHDAVLERLNSSLTDLEKKRGVINEAVEELNKLGISGVAKNVELNVEAVKKLGAKPSQIDLVLAAIEKVKQDLQGAVRDVSFVLMVKQNQVLRDKTLEVQAQIMAEGLAVRITADKIKLIEVFSQMHEQRKLYVAAFAEIDETVARFLSSMKSDSSSPLNKQVSDFIVSANGFVDYLNQLSYL
ncbi:alpha-xenorhabdolysin family binary toxin subunit A [Pseudomonas sp. Pseusp3]|uniref:alpha-xenorhabdolysin family binary toxin subunit A n=1 Tax=Pseudomonas sp. Pseusp3 TaxID=3243029 RepID=UPI0039AFE17A